MRFVVPILPLAAGCVPALPPPAHWAPMPATAAREEPAITVVGTCCFSAGADVGVPLGPNLAVDVGAQAGPYTAGGGLGLWVRSAEEVGTVYGLRLGLSGGTGDILGTLPYAMPYGGFNVHGQAVVRDERGHRVSVTAGVAYQTPVFAPSEPTVETDDGGTAVVFPLPDLWLGLDVNGELAASDDVAVVIGGGVRFLVVPVIWPIPTLSGGLTF